MPIRHPLVMVPEQARKPVFFGLLVLTAILFAVFRALNVPLVTPAAPGGIVTFEMAGNIKKSAEILLTWDENADLFAAFGLGLDYLFMSAYALTLSLGALLAAGKHAGWFETLGAVAGWGALIAALFDAVENFALWQILTGALVKPWPELAAFCAGVKFGLLLLVILVVMLGWLLPKRAEPIQGVR